MKFIYDVDKEYNINDSRKLHSYIKNNKISKEEKACIICNTIYNKDITRYVSEYFINEYDKTFKYIRDMKDFFSSSEKANIVSRFLGLKEVSHDDNNVLLRLSSSMLIQFALTDYGLFTNREIVSKSKDNFNQDLILAYDENVFRYIIKTDGICLSNLDDALKYMNHKI